MILIIVTILLFIAYTAGIGVAFYFLYKKAEKAEIQAKKLNETSSQTLSSLAEDVDTIFANTAYDPQRLTSISRSNNVSTFDISTGSTNRLVLGKNAYVSYNALTDTVSIGNEKGPQNITLKNNAVSVAPVLELGDYKLVPRNNGLNVCTQQGCNVISLGPATT